VNTKKLLKLGFDTSLISENSNREFSPARVIEVNKNSYLVSNGEYEMKAELSGRYLFSVKDALDYPTVGDWVLIQILDSNELAIVHSLFERKTVLKRKCAGKNIDFQLIASNIDCGLIVQSACDPNVNLIERYLVELNQNGIESVVIFTKTDLVSGEQLRSIQNSLAAQTVKVLCISNTTVSGIDSVARMLQYGKTYCLLGQSGVGKSSLLNNLVGSGVHAVNEVREKDGKGRHTTVSRQLVCLLNGAVFIDTPGIREFATFQVQEGIGKTFDDFSLLAQRCQFADCSHTHEKGCAVKNAVAGGDVDEDRYYNYLKLKKESEHYDISYVQRRRKDRAFGKMVKIFKKGRNHR
jgi:ribosome biogenesis GTPase